MKTQFAISIALKNLKRRKLRTVLTVFAVVIGATLVSSMVSLGLGMQRMVVDALKNAGELTDINVYENDEGSVKLDSAVLDSFKKMEGVERVDPMVTIVAEKFEISGYIKEGGMALVSALSESSRDIYEVITGRDFKAGEEGAAIVGENFIQDFSTDPPESYIGKFINLTFGEKNIQVKIIGVAKAENMMGYGIIVPLSFASNLKRVGSYDSVKIKASSLQDVAGISAQVEDMGFQAVTLDSLVSQITKYFRIVELALGSFGIIIIGVAALGIINTMVMAIYERTREIGVMRAVGASRRDIIKLFSFEAGIIGFIGGLIGIICGFGITYLLGLMVNGYLSSRELLTAKVNLFAMPWWLILGITVFTTGVGLLAGLYPAFRAARLNPVEALRHE